MEYGYLSNGQRFTHTPDAEIIEQYQRGLPIRTIVQGLVWHDRIAKTAAKLRVARVLMEHQLPPRYNPFEV